MNPYDKHKGVTGLCGQIVLIIPIENDKIGFHGSGC